MNFLFLSPTNDSVDILSLNKGAQHFAAGVLAFKVGSNLNIQRDMIKVIIVFPTKQTTLQSLKSFREEYLMMRGNSHSLMTEQVRVMVKNIGFRLCSQISLHSRVSSDTF